MVHPIKLSTLTALCTASALFALDEYNPVPARVMQINVGLERTSVSGQYQSSWESDELANVNNPTTIPMQDKFGLLDNLEGSMEVDYLIEDTQGHTGLDRPKLALKYGDPVSGGGGYLAISLPIGFEDIMNAGNFATMTFGGMFNRNFPRVNLMSNISYSFNTEDNNKNKVDNLRFFAKPEMPVTPKPLVAKGQYLGVSLGTTYQYFFNTTVNGDASEDKAHLLTIAPGVSYTYNKIISAEMQFPISVAGQLQPDTQSFRLELFFTLDEGLYNSL